MSCRFLAGYQGRSPWLVGILQGARTLYAREAGHLTDVATNTTMDQMPKSEVIGDESRAEVRGSFDQRVRVTDLTSVKSSFPAQSIDYSSHGLGLESCNPLPVGRSLFVEWGGTMVLGEVATVNKTTGNIVWGLKLII